MITDSELIRIGRFGKPHGINGEVSASIDEEVDMGALSCVVTDMEGIFVPFFISAMRPKSTETVLLTLDGITDENEAKLFNGKPLYALRRDNAVTDTRDSDEDGFYAADLIGFTITDSAEGPVGVITDIEDSTENVLFIVERPDGGATVYIPVADDYIDSIDAENRNIVMTLPDGLL